MVLAGYAGAAGAVEPSAVLQQPTGRVFVGQATVMIRRSTACRCSW